MDIEKAVNTCEIKRGEIEAKRTMAGYGIDCAGCFNTAPSVAHAALPKHFRSNLSTVRTFSIDFANLQRTSGYPGDN